MIHNVQSAGLKPPRTRGRRAAHATRHCGLGRRHEGARRSWPQGCVRTVQIGPRITIGPRTHLRET
eukprot:458974-Lingulodinium_polyedra.AAC.1